VARESKDQVMPGDTREATEWRRKCALFPRSGASPAQTGRMSERLHERSGCATTTRLSIGQPKNSDGKRAKAASSPNKLPRLRPAARTPLGRGPRPRSQPSGRAGPCPNVGYVRALDCLGCWRFQSCRHGYCYILLPSAVPRPSSAWECAVISMRPSVPTRDIPAADFILTLDAVKRAC
jgi:hypothetical protein